MLKNIKDPQDARQIMLSLLSTSGTLAGVGLVLLSIVNLKIVSTKIGTVADDLFLFASFGFVVECYIIFFALRHLHSPRLRYWTNMIDTLFLCSLTLLLIAGAMVVYSFL